jgi:ribosomal protein S18 acetylase RimI-like enzyme
VGRISEYLECKVHPQQALMPRVSYVVVEHGLVIGFIAGHLTRHYGCDGELEWINVSRDCRRAGVGSALLLLLAEWFSEQKASKVCVNVDPANTAATRFYARHGAGKLNEHWLVWQDISSVLGRA